MSFIEEEDRYSLLEKMMKHIFKEVLNVEIKIPFPRITHKEAINKYHTDRPHLKKDTNKYSFLWVIDFPLFDYNKDEKRFISTHHPFTMPKEEDLKNLDKNPGKAKSKAYDLVLNGEEIAGGSIRIHKEDIQKSIFKALKINDKEAKEKFGFLLDAFKYGAPPHGGIAFGFDRLVTIMCGEDSIRDVIAFPKNKDAKDLMLNAPSSVNKSQLNELGLKTK